MRSSFTITMVPDLSTPPRRNHNVFHMTLYTGVIEFPFFICSICVNLRNRIGSLLSQQCFSRCRIINTIIRQFHRPYFPIPVNRYMCFHPLPVSGVAMLSHFPFTFPVNFQPRTIQNGDDVLLLPCWQLYGHSASS